jgi:NADH-quinone oxidoreductase subunit J
MPDLVFLVLSGVVVVSAIAALEAKELIYGAIGLAFSLIGVAGIFLVLGEEYLAMFQVAVYVGAVVVLIMFTIMLVRRDAGRPVEEEEPGRLGRAGAFVAGLIALAIAAAMYLVIPYSAEMPILSEISLQDLGRTLASGYALALVILGLLIGATAVGALTLAKIEPEEEPNGTT